jgi:hypothetical protein
VDNFDSFLANLLENSQSDSGKLDHIFLDRLSGPTLPQIQSSFVLPNALPMSFDGRGRLPRPGYWEEVLKMASFLAWLEPVKAQLGGHTLRSGSVPLYAVGRPPCSASQSPEVAETVQHTLLQNRGSQSSPWVLCAVPFRQSWQASSVGSPCGDAAGRAFGAAVQRAGSRHTYAHQLAMHSRERGNAGC